MNKIKCPPCTGMCNQGRLCEHSKALDLVDILAIVAMAAAVFVPVALWYTGAMP